MWNKKEEIMESMFQHGYMIPKIDRKNVWVFDGISLVHYENKLNKTIKHNVTEPSTQGKTLQILLVTFIAQNWICSHYICKFLTRNPIIYNSNFVPYSIPNCYFAAFLCLLWPIHCPCLSWCCQCVALWLVYL